MINTMNNSIFAISQAHKTDAYKLGHIEQYVPGTEVVYSSCTARNFRLAHTIPQNNTDKMVMVGVQLAVHMLKDNWNATFFSQPKEKVINAYRRRVKNCVGPDNGDVQIAAMADLHDLGYLPLRIKSLPEGSLVNKNTPFFTVVNTDDRFFWLTNNCETFLSCMVWSMCNSASVAQQYFLTSKRWAEKTATPEAAAAWLPIANHDFSARGLRGDQDAMMSGVAHLMFGVGTDTLWAIDGLEQYYGADSDKEWVGVSVNATEHATTTQGIHYYGSEEESLKRLLTDVYPRGILSYVADSKDYYYVISELAAKLEPVIVSREPDSLGLPGKLVFRPDSSPKTPLEVICGERYKDIPNFRPYLQGRGLNNLITPSLIQRGYQVFRCKTSGKYYEVDGNLSYKEISEEEVKGSLQILWEVFGGVVNEKGYKVLHPSVGLIYGEAITMEMQEAIYSRMEELGFCVTNLLLGVGSWAKLKNSSRDSYGIALKGGYSVVGGEGFGMNKTPKTDMSKASREGLLRVELEKGEDGQEMYVTYDNQTVEQEAQGELKVVFEDGELYNQYTLSEIRSKLGVM